MTNETEKLIEEAEKITEHVPGDWTACKCNKCGLVWALGEMHIVTVELETEDSDVPQPSPEQRRRIMDFMARSRSMIPELAAALRRAETERDKALKQSAGWEIQAQDLRDRLVKAEAERDAQHEQVLRLTAERDEARVVHACPPKDSGVMPCCGATPFEKQGERLTADPALVNCDRQRLIAENARLQKEHNAYVQRLSADALQVASKYQRDLDEARAQIATLELLQRGGK